MRNWRASHPERVREISLKSKRKWRVSHREQIIAKLTATNNSRRRDIVAFFGGVCAHCPTTDPRVLQMDHINGGGAAERRAGRMTLYYRWRAIRDDPEAARRKFQLLCANCNIIKRCERGEYNHQGRPQVEFKGGE